MGFDVLLSEDRRAGGDTAHHRQAGRVVDQYADAARGGGRESDGALAREGLQVVFSGGGRAPAAPARAPGPRRRRTGGGDVLADEVEDMALAIGEHDSITVVKYSTDVTYSFTALSNSSTPVTRKAGAPVIPLHPLHQTVLRSVLGLVSPFRLCTFRGKFPARSAAWSRFAKSRSCSSR